MGEDANKKGRDIAVVFGIPFHRLTFGGALEECKRSIGTAKPTYVVAVDLGVAVSINQDEELKHIVFHAEKILCRSQLLVYIAKKFGILWLKRIALSSLVPSLLIYCDNNRCSLYLLGSTEEDIEKSVKFIKRRYPNIKISGTHARPSGEMFGWNHGELSYDIEKAKPDFLLCALGDEENIKWMGTHYRQYRANLSFPVGADFRCVQGYRLDGEGVWGKFLSRPFFYLKKIITDGLFVWRELRKQEEAVVKVKQSQTMAPSLDLEASHVFHKIVWQGRIEQLKLGETQMPPDNTRNIVCDCSGVTFIDSAGLGQMAHLKRTAAKYGKFFCLYRPSDVIVHALRAMRLDKHILSVWSSEGLEDELKRHEESLVLIKVADNGHDYVLKPLVDLKERTLKKLEKDIQNIYPTLSKYGKIVVDLEYVDFIDSAAVGGILAIKGQLDRESIGFKLEHVRGNALKTLQALKLDDVLVAPMQLEVI